MITSLRNALENMSRSLKECIADYLSQTELFEMAYDRRTYMNKVFDRMLQIMENWCLIKYARLNNTNTQLINHWKTELKSQLVLIQSMKLKSGDKLKATKHSLITEMEYNTLNVTYLLEAKFTKENMWDESKVRIISGMFNKEVYKLCELMASSTPEDITKYIKTL